MKIKVTRPDGILVWQTVLMDGTVRDIGIHVGTDGQLWALGDPDPILPPWKLEIVPGSGEEDMIRQDIEPHPSKPVR